MQHAQGVRTFLHGLLVPAADLVLEALPQGSQPGPSQSNDAGSPEHSGASLTQQISGLLTDMRVLAAATATLDRMYCELHQSAPAGVAEFDEREFISGGFSGDLSVESATGAAGSGSSLPSPFR